MIFGGKVSKFNELSCDVIQRPKLKKTGNDRCQNIESTLLVFCLCVLNVINENDMKQIDDGVN